MLRHKNGVVGHKVPSTSYIRNVHGHLHTNSGAYTSTTYLAPLALESYACAPTNCHNTRIRSTVSLNACSPAQWRPRSCPYCISTAYSVIWCPHAAIHKCHVCLWVVVLYLLCATSLNQKHYLEAHPFVDASMTVGASHIFCAVVNLPLLSNQRRDLCKPDRPGCQSQRHPMHIRRKHTQ